MQKNDEQNKRDELIDNILQNWGYDNYQRVKLGSDASFRKYEILKTNNEEHILMDAPPEFEDVRPFVSKAKILNNMGLKAPCIYNEDAKNGVLVLENFGERKFNNEITNHLEREQDLYKNALDILNHVAQQTCPVEVEEYDNQVLTNEAKLFSQWYLKHNNNFDESALAKITDEYEQIIKKLIAKLKLKNNVFVLRDYHADNLMILDDNKELKSLGLLDFQDGLRGNITYDVVSLLEDARRDVSRDLQLKMIDYFCEVSGSDKNIFLNDYNILGAQRNLKILGIFTRLCYRDGKKHYLDFNKRVLSYLKQDLEHSACDELKDFLVNKCKI